MAHRLLSVDAPADRMMEVRLDMHSEKGGKPAIGLGQWIAARAMRSPERQALTCDGETWTYRMLDERIREVTARLHARGVRPGERVGFLGLNDPLFLVTMFAAARIGAVFVPLNFRLAAPEIAFIVRDAGITLLVVGPEQCRAVDAIRETLGCASYLATAPVDGWETLDEAGGASGSDALIHVPDEDDVALLMYTSGTMGYPKGVMLTHGNLWWNNVNVMLSMDILSDDVSLVCAPLFHIAGLNANTLPTLMKGGHVVLHRNFDPGRFFDDVARYRVTTSFAVPAMLLFISQHQAFATSDLSSLRMFIVGAAPVPLQLLGLYAERGISLQQGYGLTETAPTASFLGAEYAYTKVGSAGKPPLLSDIRIVDEHGVDIDEPHRIGEVCVRGPNVMKGYWNRPAETARAMLDGDWFRSGDAGYRDEDGFLYLVDRLKDMIISGGENIYSAEVESALYDHPAISEAAVIGVADAVWGETVVAVVSLKAGMDLTLDGMQSFLDGRLARYKIPRRLEIVETLPRTETGKVRKQPLRSKFESV